jgi:hypothetical protein
MVLVIPSPSLSVFSLTTLAGQLAVKAKHLGKARRFVSGTPLSQSVAREFYKSFHCVEFMTVDGKCTIVDDGDERVVEAEVILSGPV